MIAAMFWMIVGTISASQLIGNMVVSVQYLDTENEEQQRKIEALKQFKIQNNLEASIEYRIKKHIETKINYGEFMN